MEDNISFEKGYMPSIDRLSLPKGSYLDALNMMRDSTGNLITEHGTVESVSLQLGSKVLGSVMVGDDIVLSSITSSGNSVIGILSIDDVYTEVINNSNMGFTSNRVNMESKIDYKGNRIIYIGGEGIKLRRINLDNIPAEDFDKVTSLFLEYDLPYVEGIEVTSGGSVKSGVYQFAVRLVTASNNTTSFGSISGVIPIGTGSEADGRKNVDGADPQTQTSSIISLQASNIDTSFEYFEPCVITYIGNANQIKIRSLGKRAIVDRGEISFSYSGEDDETDTILEEELNIDSTYYESAKYVTQKDSTLILAGLTEKVDNVNWQEVANSIVMQYEIHEVERTEEINIVNGDGVSYKDTPIGAANGSGWTDEGILGDFNDYKNPIIASKFRGYRRGEVYSFTFTPIFIGGRRGNAYHIPSLTTEEAQVLGVDVTRPLTVVETQNYTYPEGHGNLTNQLVRYHKMPSVQDEPFYTESGGQEYIRMLGVSATITAGDSWKDTLAGYIIGREDRSGKETILAQGITRDFYEGGETKGTWIPVPGFGNTKVQHTYYTDHLNSEDVHKRIFTFHAPDLQIDPSVDYVPTKLRRVAKYNADYEFCNSGTREVSDFMRSMINSKPGTVTDDVMNLTDGIKYIPGESHSSTDNHREGPDGTNLTRTIFDIKTSYRRISECHALKTTSDLVRNRTFTEEFHDRNGEENFWYLMFSRNTELDLYNIEVERLDYYGDVYDKVAIPINTVLFNRGSIDPRNNQVLEDSTTVSFGGDTFISKFALVMKTTGRFEGTIGANQTIPKTSTIVYLMVESNNNYNFRHYRQDDIDTVGSIPYYPKYRILSGNSGICDYVVGLGTASLYNKQYSAQNTLKQTYSKAIGEETITSFDNRLAYSATSVEGEKFDAFRLFLVSNYHDVPKQHGKITGIFPQGSDLYTHTQRCLWRNFYNTLATQATSAGDIVLGNGGAFPRPSIPIITTDGGYAGCKDISASVSTPMGRFFFDAYRSKMYHLSGELLEISNPVIFEKLRKDAYGKDAVLGYDYGRKRILMSSENLTLSFNPQLSSYDGRHSYKFDHFISRDIKDYIISGNEVHSFTDKVIGTYFNEVYPSKVSVVSVAPPTMSKRYTSLYSIISAFNPADFKHIPFAFFDTFKAYSFERSTGVNVLHKVDYFNTDLESLGTMFVHKANNKYRMGIPPDVVIDPYQDIEDPLNLVTRPGYPEEDKAFLPDMIDNHMVFEFVLDNNTQRLLKVHSFIINFEENHT